MPECRSCGLIASFATNPIADLTTTTNSNILTCSGSSGSTVPGNVLQSGFTCHIGFFAYMIGGATTASGLVAGTYGCVACAAPTSVTSNVIVNAAAFVTPTAGGSNSAAATTTAALNGVFRCTYTAATTISATWAITAFASFTCINGVAPTNGGLAALIGV